MSKNCLVKTVQTLDVLTPFDHKSQPSIERTAYYNWEKLKKRYKLHISVNLLYWIDLKATNEDNKDGESSAINKSREEASTRCVIQTFAKADDDKQLSLEI